MQKNIFHIHTYICKHSSNHLEDIVEYALKHKYKTLYFTEHAPITVDCPYRVRRASYDEIAQLKRDIDKVNAKYKNRLKIYFGYEVEFNKDNRWYIQRLARDPYCQFFAFGNHFYGDLFKIRMPLPLVMHVTHDKKQLPEFKCNNIAAAQSGLMSWFAHPEIFLNSYQKWDQTAINVCKNIIKLAQDYHLPLAFNVNFESYSTKSKWHYPCEYFWKLVSKTNIPVIIESDSHDIHTIHTEWLKKAHDLAISFGLKKNLTEKISLKLFDKKPQLFICDSQIYKGIPYKLINELKNNNVKIVTLKAKEDLEKCLLKKHVAPAWTIVATCNKKIANESKKLGAFLYYNSKVDLLINQLSKANYKSIRKSFISEA